MGAEREGAARVASVASCLPFPFALLDSASCPLVLEAGMGSDFLALGFAVPFEFDVDALDLVCGLVAVTLEVEADFLRLEPALLDVDADLEVDLDLDLGLDDEEEVDADAGASDSSERESSSAVRSTKTDGCGEAAMATKERGRDRQRKVEAMLVKVGRKEGRNE